jgi:hypothetical protein
MKNLLRSVVAIGVVSQTMFGCGLNKKSSVTALSQAPSESSASDGENKPDVAILYFGGFSSCSHAPDLGYPDDIEPLISPQDKNGMSMTRWVAKIGQAVPKPHRALVACYPTWTNLANDSNEAAIEKEGDGVQTQFPHHVNALDANIYFRHNLPGHWIPTQKVKLRDLLASLQSQLKSQKIRKVAILGHSYGGYTSILVAKALSKKDSEIKVTSLITLDPISMDTCQPANIAYMLQKSAASPGCNQAPATGLRDNNITSAEINDLAANIPWTNLWQGADTYLHSSPISASGVDNIEIVYNKDKKGGVLNHIWFLYPDEKTKENWPKIVDSIISKIRDYLN